MKDAERSFTKQSCKIDATNEWLYNSTSFCRICLEVGKPNKKLVSPCYCIGSVGQVHVSCLERWLTYSSAQKCEICGFKYILRRRSVSLMEFIRNPGTTEEKQQFKCDLWLIVILLCFAIISLWKFLLEVNRKMLTLNNCTIFFFFISIVGILRHCCRILKLWKRRKQQVKITSLTRKKYINLKQNSKKTNHETFNDFRSQTNDIVKKFSVTRKSVPKIERSKPFYALRSQHSLTNSDRNSAKMSKSNEKMLSKNSNFVVCTRSTQRLRSNEA